MFRNITARTFFKGFGSPFLKGHRIYLPAPLHECFVMFQQKLTFLAYLTMAVAMGCSLLPSAVPAIANSWLSEHTCCSTNIAIRDTRGTPCVTVPVLSKTMLCTLWAVSSGSPPLMRMPLIAPTPVPTMTAVGVASPRAHGHAMQRTVMANLKACSNMTSWRLRSSSIYGNEKCNFSHCFLHQHVKLIILHIVSTLRS